jgi:large subunit ribosomal protein L29
LKRLKTSELAGLSDQDLVKRLNDLRAELSRLRSSAARGTLKKELGEIKTVRRNIARVITASNEKKRASSTPQMKKAQDKDDEKAAS